MANIVIPPEWTIPGRRATPRSVYLDRRAFIRRLGMGAAALGVAGCGTDFQPTAPGEGPAPGDGSSLVCNDDPPAGPLQTICPSPNQDLFPAAPADGYPVPYGDPTDRIEAATYNNYYEFIGGVSDIHIVWPYVGPFRVWPWTVEVRGEADNTGTFDVAELERELGLEERVYRHRCVEPWSMVVPWTGYPLRALIEKLRPNSFARYVRFVSFDRPEEAVGQKAQPFYNWPFYEALRLDEAMNELAFVATGIYGEPLPKQHGAPWRLVVPWKYGFKSIKAMTLIEFTRERPSTFWPDFGPDEYGFYSNVNPEVAHPRWSQAEEIPLGAEQPIATRLFNGYAPDVADLYDLELLTYIS